MGGIGSSILGIFGGKVGIYAMLGSALLVLGMYGYIKYQGAVNAVVTSKLERERDRTKAANERIKIMAEDQARFETRVLQLSQALEGMQAALARNSQQRRVDYSGMTSKRPLPGQSADTAAMERQANTGMNALFMAMIQMSRVPAPQEQK